MLININYGLMRWVIHLLGNFTGRNSNTFASNALVVSKILADRVLVSKVLLEKNVK
ncbi:MAG: hypothetical protein ACJA2G_001935 [Cognaticolwellia sp.]|jgi:hypothetical protein